MATELKKMYEDMGSPSGLTQDQLEEKTKTINELSSQITTQKRKVGELKEKANDYYEEHNLGKK